MDLVCLYPIYILSPSCSLLVSSARLTIQHPPWGGSGPCEGRATLVSDGQGKDIPCTWMLLIVVVPPHFERYSDENNYTL